VIRPALLICAGDAIAWPDGRIVYVDAVAARSDEAVELSGHLPSGQWVGRILLPARVPVVVLARDVDLLAGPVPDPGNV
jgi:hypothetical protein